MERAVTYSDHSGTVTTRYFTRATHKSYGPMTQLLPGPRCPNVTHVPTVLLQTSSPSLYPSPSHFATLPAAAPSIAPPFHARPAFRHPLPPPPLCLLFLSPVHVCLSVCPVCPFVSLIMLCTKPFAPPPCTPPQPHLSGAPSPCNICSDRQAILGAAAGLVRFMLREDGRLRSPAGVSLCHQRLASTLRQMPSVWLPLPPPSHPSQR